MSHERLLYFKDIALSLGLASRVAKPKSATFNVSGEMDAKRIFYGMCILELVYCTVSVMTTHLRFDISMVQSLRMDILQFVNVALQLIYCSIGNLTCMALQIWNMTAPANTSAEV